MIAAGVTAFYMSRLFLMTFHGKRRWTDDVHPHESPLLMTVPMMVLAVGSAFLGLLLGPTGAIEAWLSPVVGEHGEEHPVLPIWVITVLTMLLVAAGVGLAYLRYVRSDVLLTAPVGSFATRAARRDLYQDELNEAVFMRPGQQLTHGLVQVDNHGVDGAVRGFAGLIGASSGGFAGCRRGWCARTPSPCSAGSSSSSARWRWLDELPLADCHRRCPAGRGGRGSSAAPRPRRARQDHRSGLLTADARADHRARPALRRGRCEPVPAG
jgi:hypothetical protein